MDAIKAEPDAQLRLLDVQAVDTAIAQLLHRRKTLPEHADISRLQAERAALASELVASDTAVSDLEREQARAEAEALPRAHAITKWLGRDADDVVPRVGERELTGPGWVLVCSDGLWNYASGPAELAAQLDAAGSGDDPVAVAGPQLDFTLLCVDRHAELPTVLRGGRQHREGLDLLGGQAGVPGTLGIGL